MCLFVFVVFARAFEVVCHRTQAVSVAFDHGFDSRLGKTFDYRRRVLDSEYRLPEVLAAFVNVSDEGFDRLD